MTPGFVFRNLRFRWAKTISVFALFAYFSCLFGHGLSDAIGLAFSKHGHHIDIIQDPQGGLQVAWVHEPETQHSGLHEHDAESSPSSHPADQDSLLCDNEATAIPSSGFPILFSGLKAIPWSHLLIFEPKVAIQASNLAAAFANGDTNLRRLNSVLLRV